MIKWFFFGGGDFDQEINRTFKDVVIFQFNSRISKSSIS